MLTLINPSFLSTQFLNSSTLKVWLDFDAFCSISIDIFSISVSVSLSFSNTSLSRKCSFLNYTSWKNAIIIEWTKVIGMSEEIDTPWKRVVTVAWKRVITITSTRPKPPIVEPNLKVNSDSWLVWLLEDFPFHKTIISKI